MSDESCDVVVIGGGPGGSATATLLADDGFNVVLLERAHFPREHVGESLLPASLPVLEELGVLPAIEAAGFTTKRGATMVWGSDTEPWSWYFSDSKRGALTSFQVVRSEFDHLLLKNASEHGVEVREGHQVLEVEFEGRKASGVRFQVVGNGESAGDGQSESGEGRIGTRFVVDASGQSALLSRKLELQQWDSFFQNLAVYSYYKGARLLEPPNDGNIFIESFEHGWLWMIPLHTGVVSVGAVVDRETGQEGLRAQGAAEFLAAQIAQAPYMADHLAEATRVEEPRVVRDWSYTSSAFAGEGYVLVGDAACFVDPLFSSGVHLALQASRLAATYVRSTLNDPALTAQAAESYRTLYERQYRHFHATAQLFYATNRSSEGYFWEARRILGEDGGTPRQAFAAIVSGQREAGYERAVIERGEVPPDILHEIRRLERLTDEREAAAEAFEGAEGAERLLAWIPTLGNHVKVERKSALRGGQAGQRYVIRAVNAPESASELPLSDLTATAVSEMDRQRTVGEIIRGLQEGASASRAGVVADTICQDIAFLYRAGVVQLTPPETSRNDACPCGSGRKFKRCHGR